MAARQIGHVITCCAIVFWSGSALSQPPANPPDTLGWGQIPVDGFPIVPAKTPKSKKALEKLQKEHDAFYKQFEGKHFYGLCEVQSVTPASNGKFRVLALELAELDSYKHLHHPGDSKVPFAKACAEWLTDEHEAMQLAPNDRFNISGDIKSLSSEGGGKILGDDRIATVSLENVRH